MASDLLRKRREASAKRQRVRERVAKEATLTPAKRAARERRRDRAKVATEARRAQAATEALEKRHKREEERAAQAAATAAAAARQQAAVAEVLRLDAAAQQAAAASPTPPVAASKRAAPPPAPPVHRTSTLSLLSHDRACAVKPAALPARAALECAASTQVFSADAAAGVSAWDEEAGGWAHPEGWRTLVDALYAAYGTPSAAGVEVVAGEYNAVFRPDDAHPVLPDALRRLLRIVRPDEVVVRVTRPDADVQTNGKPHIRFKPLVAMVRELYHTLHATANDLAPRVRAALLFPSVVRHGVQLYGALYVCDRAERDATRLLDEHVQRLAASGGAQYAERMRSAGAQVARRVTHLLHRQSALGALNADVKLGNIVFDDAGRAMAIDFDGAMYSLMHEGTGWAAHLLANLALVTAHVRAFCDQLLADGWVAEARPLLLELLGAAKALGAGGSWVFAARARPRKFTDLYGDSRDDAATRLEFIVHSYFTEGKHPRVRFDARYEPTAPPLVEQLVCFCLFGHTDGDAAIRDALSVRVSGWPKEF